MIICLNVYLFYTQENKLYYMINYPKNELCYATSA